MDVPGFMVGSKVEHEGIIATAQKCCTSWRPRRFPKADGGGAQRLRCGLLRDGRTGLWTGSLFAWPGPKSAWWVRKEMVESPARSCLAAWNHQRKWKRRSSGWSSSTSTSWKSRAGVCAMTWSIRGIPGGCFWFGTEDGVEPHRRAPRPQTRHHSGLSPQQKRARFLPARRITPKAISSSRDVCSGCQLLGKQLMSKTRLRWFAMGAVLCGCGDSGAGGTTIGPAGPVGPAGPEGKSGNQAPALTLFTPQVAFAGRTVSVQISGGGTAFTGSKVIDFADVAINTDSVSALGSVSNLRASVSIGPSAQVGPHDVTVVSGTDVFKLAGGFTVAASLKPNTLTAPSVGAGRDWFRMTCWMDHQVRFSSGFRLNGGLHTVSQTSLSATRTVGMGSGGCADSGGRIWLPGKLCGSCGSAHHVHNRSGGLCPQSDGTHGHSGHVDSSTSGTELAAPLSDNLYQLSTSANDQVLFGQFIGLGSAFAGGNVTKGAAYAGSDGKFGGGQLVLTSANLAANTRTMLAWHRRWEPDTSRLGRQTLAEALWRSMVIPFCCLHLRDKACADRTRDSGYRCGSTCNDREFGCNVAKLANRWASRLCGDSDLLALPRQRGLRACTFRLSRPALRSSFVEHSRGAVPRRWAAPRQRGMHSPMKTL